MITKRFLKKYYERERDNQKLEYTLRKGHRSARHYPIIRKALVEFLLDRSIFAEEVKSFLEVGCSEGWYVDYAARHVTFAVGIDISWSKIKCDYSEKRGHYLVADAENLPFKEESFDLVLCTEVLEHLLNPELCVRELFRISKDRLIMTVPIRFTTLWGHIRGKLEYRTAKDKMSGFDRPFKGHINEPDLKTLREWFLSEEWDLVDCFVIGNNWLERLNSIRELQVLDFPFSTTIKRLLAKISRRFSVPFEKPIFIAIVLNKKGIYQRP